MNPSFSESEPVPLMPPAPEDQSSFVFMRDLRPLRRMLRLAVIGGSGLVGVTLLQVLKERDFPLSELHLFASVKSEGRWLDTPFGALPLETLRAGKLPSVDIAFMAAGAAAAPVFFFGITKRRLPSAGRLV